MARDNWGVDDVRRRCTEYREILGDAPHCCTAEELAAYWPGGKENPYPGRGGWLYCYGTYRAFLWKLKDAASQGGVDDDARHLALEKALASEPERVELEHVDEVGVRLTRSVFQKSFTALMHAMDRDNILYDLTSQYRKLRRLGTTPAAELMGRVLVEIAYQHQVLAWLVCSPQPGIPWDETETRPTPPDWTGHLAPIDLVRIIQAHRRVNGTQLQIASVILGTEGGEDREPTSWATIMTTASKQLSRSSRSLMRDEPLVSLVTQLLVTHTEEAKQRAQAERRTRSPQATAVPFDEIGS